MAVLVGASAGIFLLVNVAVGRFAGSDSMETAIGGGQLPPEWEFVQPALAQLRSTAIQACSQEVAVAAAVEERKEVEQAQLAAIVREYDREMVAYNEQMGSAYRSGLRRPRAVPPVAPPIEVTKSRTCLKAAVMPQGSPTPLARTSADGSFVANPAPLDGSRFLTLAQLDEAAIEAGWPMEPGWWPEMRLIVQCETASLDTMAYNPDDPNGGSYGLAQLNGAYHFENAGEDFALRFDPVVNLRTALWLRTVRGRFGGTGGWYNCANRYGIP